MPFSKTAWYFTILKRATTLGQLNPFCDKFHARMILAAAEMYCPEAVAEIEEAIRLSRTLH